MPSATIGYARTSTVDQLAGLDAQQRDLEAAAFLTNPELEGVRLITVLGQSGSRSIRR